MSARKQRHFGEKNVIPPPFYYEVLQKRCRVKTSQVHGCSFGFFLSAQEAQWLPATKITEQPILRTKSGIRRPGYKFLKYFR